MSTINELSKEQEEILNILFALDDEDEEDLEKIEFLHKRLNHIHGSAENTVLFLNGIWLECRDIASKRKEANQRAERRQKTADNAEKRLKNRIIEICETFDIKKVINNETGEGIRTQMSPGSLVYDNTKFNIDRVPEYCKEIIPEHAIPINKEIKKLIDSGVKIEGAEIVKSLGIRTI